MVQLYLSELLTFSSVCHFVKHHGVKLVGPEYSDILYLYHNINPGYEGVYPT